MTSIPLSGRVIIVHMTEEQRQGSGFVTRGREQLHSAPTVMVAEHVTPQNSERLRRLAQACEQAAENDPELNSELDDRIDWIKGQLVELPDLDMYGPSAIGMLKKYATAFEDQSDNDFFSEPPRITTGKFVSEVPIEQFSDPDVMAAFTSAAGGLAKVFCTSSHVTQYGAGHQWNDADQHGFAVLDPECSEGEINDYPDKISKTVGFNPEISSALLVAFEQPAVDMRLVFTRDRRLGIRVDLADGRTVDVFLAQALGGDGVHLRAEAGGVPLVDSDYSFVLSQTELENGPYQDTNDPRQRVTLVMIP